MKLPLAAALLMAATWVHGADALTPAQIEASEANRREYRLTRLEQRVSKLAVEQVVLRQQLLDHVNTDDKFTRKQCEQIAQGMRAEDSFKYLGQDLRELDTRGNRSKFTPEQLQRLAEVKKKLASLKEDASVDCKALVPFDP